MIIKSLLYVECRENCLLYDVKESDYNEEYEEFRSSDKDIEMYENSDGILFLFKDIKNVFDEKKKVDFIMNVLEEFEDFDEDYKMKIFVDS